MKCRIKQSAVITTSLILFGGLMDIEPVVAGCIIKCITVKTPSPPKITPPKINVPKIDLGNGVSLTPLGPVPNPVVDKADATLNKALQDATPAANAILAAGAKSVTASATPSIALTNVIAGKTTLGDAAKSVTDAEGTKYAAVGQAVSEVNAASNNIQVVAAESIAGNVGKTVMTLGTGPNRLSVDFAATAVIVGGETLKGQPLEDVIAVPFAAALRSANLQFLPDSKPLPPNVMNALKGSYPEDVLQNARYAIGSVSVSVPDVVINYQKITYGDSFAVTVGNVTVFSQDPADNMHWWAHEMQHQVQYQGWGVDQFAYKYITSCHAVESEAESKAQQVAPLTSPVKVLC